MKKIIKIFIFYFIFIQCLFATKGQVSLIRDTEIENFLYEISRPIFISAGLDPKSIKFYIVNDNSINAFVMGGQNIFVNTGTLTSFDEPDAVLGILAHETGHISAGHLARSSEDIKNMGNISIGAILLGIGTLIAGIPEIGQAIIFGTMQVQQQSFLKYSRGHEETADNLAVKYLNDNNLSSLALLKSMDKFYMNELQYSNNMEYYSTHPLSRNRKQFIENKVKNEKYNNKEFNEKYKDKFNFIKSKILAYNGNYKNEKQDNDYDIYASSITNMNNGKNDNSLEEIDILIQKYKNNPYFYELKGDIYLRQNDIKNALYNYNIADEMIKNNTLIKKMIAFIIVKYKQQDMYKIAIDKLNYIIQYEKDDVSALKLLAEAYYNNKELSLSYLTLAKYYVVKKENNIAKKYIKLAEENTTNKNILKKIEDLKITIDKK